MFLFFNLIQSHRKPDKGSHISVISHIAVIFSYHSHICTYVYVPIKASVHNLNFSKEILSDIKKIWED